MSQIRTFVAAAAIALSATAAPAQTGGLTNGPNGQQPDGLGSKQQSSNINANKPSREVTDPNSPLHQGTGADLIGGQRGPAGSEPSAPRQ